MLVYNNYYHSRISFLKCFPSYTRYRIWNRRNIQHDSDVITAVYNNKKSMYRKHSSQGPHV